MIDLFDDVTNPDAHENFQQWRRENDAGFFINLKSKNNLILRRVHCSHPGGTDWEKGGDGSLTTNPKICSSDKNELLRWAKYKFAASLKVCRDCKP